MLQRSPQVAAVDLAWWLWTLKRCQRAEGAAMK